MDEELYWSKPSNARVYHIYGNDGRSLCGKWMTFTPKKGEKVKEDDAYRKGADCKECCRKAGLLEEEE